jgi:hypothetical protein
MKAKDNFLFVFGGIFDITKEKNDMVLFDLEKNRWNIIDQEIINLANRNSPSPPKKILDMKKSEK